MRVLTVTADVPWPAVGGARTRNSHLLQAIAERHEVAVAALSWSEDEVTDAPAGIDLRTVPWELPAAHRALQEGEPRAWDELSAPAAEPLGVGWYDVPAFAELIGKLCSDLQPDVAVLTETAMARFRSELPPSLPWVLDLHDVHAVKQARQGDPDQARRLLDFESAAAAEAAVTVCVSKREASSATELLRPKRVEVVPNGVDVSYFAPAAGAGRDRRLVFTGSLHTHENVEGVLWFVEEVLPLVRDELPDVVLDIVGAQPPAQVRDLVGPAIELHADVPDTRPHLDAAGVAVVPLLHGGGTRLKVLEAAASRRAVVSTSIGVEGLPLVHGRDVDVADSPAAFASAVVNLCRDPGLREQRADAARAATREFDWRHVGRTWRSVIESVVESVA